MSLLKKITVSEKAQGDTDVLGGSFVLESGMYLSKVTMAFLDQTASGALRLNVHFKTEAGEEFRQALFITSGDDKENKSTYTKDGQEYFLPGYNQANALCLLTVGSEITEMDTDVKTLKVYNAEAREEVPTEVEVLTALIGEQIYVGLQKQIVDVRKKGDDGKYHPTGETREVNEVDKFFRAEDMLTVAEISGGAEEPKFFELWKERWEGQTRDRSTKVGNAGAPKGRGATSANGQQAQKPPKSLFSKKS